MATQHHVSRNGRLAAALAALMLLATIGRAADIDHAPIHYRDTPPNNPVSALADRVEQGKAKLEYTRDHGYLPALLRELRVPTSSQVLVFTKTSLQRQRIGPRLPRALYFNDEVYVGFCRWGEVLEISVADPRLGTVFYTLDQEPDEAPRFRRQTDTCLMCHGTTHNHGFPGHVVRSVFPDAEGNPILAAGSHRVDHATPIDKRWGGWYVTGQHGRQRHLGNTVYQRQRSEAVALLPDQQNLPNLKAHFDTGAYLSPHSDLVALMVLEHQAEMHNRITRANFLTRQACFDAKVMNELEGKPAEAPRESSTSRIKAAVEPLVEYLFFSGEATLSEPVTGTASFRADFPKAGPHDGQGRSLRDFDLQTRLFRYPCSYLIYSPAFLGLPPQAKEYAYRRIHEILDGRDQSKVFAHLSPRDRQAIREILAATHPELAAVLRTNPAARP